MSVAEIAPRNDDFERTPPQDVAAEQCVLGGMLLSKDAIADVIEVIHPADFYRPAHQLIYEAILDLYGRGEPADAITVADELTRRGEIARVGGGPYLHTLIASVPTAANAGYYAHIVRERAVLRRLVEAGTRIVQFGYAGDADVDDLVDRAQAEVYAVTERRTSEDYASLSEIMPGRARRDRGDRQPRRDADRRPDRLHRPRRAHQRPAPGPDDRHRRSTRHGQVHPGAGFRPGRRDQERHDHGAVLPGDGAQRDHHAAAVGRGAGVRCRRCAPAR